MTRRLMSWRDMLRPVRPFAFLSALVVLLPACASARAAASDEVTPMGRGASRYFAPPAPGSGEDSLADPLARALFDVVKRLGGPEAPRADARLAAVAETLAEVLGPDEVPALALQEFLLSHFGLGDPLPELAMFQFGIDDDAIRDKFAGSLPASMKRGPFGRVGIGIKRRFLGRTSVVVALQRTEVALLPVPRQLPVGETALIGGELHAGRRDPSVLVAPPTGAVERLEVRGGGDGFRATFRCARAGRHQVEVVGTGTDGKAVVANFPVFCGVDPPRSTPRAMAAGPETEDLRGAERLGFEAVNRDRAAAGLPALAWDEPLARAARSYSEEMARRQVVEHVSTESGDALDRIRKAGADALRIRENVGRANSMADAQQSFMSSPGHRANILARNITRGAIGVAVRKDGGGAATIYVTQLFAR